MSEEQKTWLIIYSVGFFTSEVLWGPLFSLASHLFSLPIGPILDGAQIFIDNKVLVYLVIIFEIFCVFEVLKMQTRHLKSRYCLIPTIIIFLLLIGSFFITYAFRNMTLF